MGWDGIRFAKEFPYVHEVFEEAEDAVSLPLVRLCTRDDVSEDLQQTCLQQPCIHNMCWLLVGTPKKS